MKKINKKGITWSMVLGIVLGGMLVLLFFKVIAIILSPYTSSKENQGMQLHFGELTEEISDLLENESKIAYERNYTFVLDPNFAIIGFNKEWIPTLETDACVPWESIPRPSECKKQPCICLFEEVGMELDDAEVVSCEIFSEIDNFYSIAYWKPSYSLLSVGYGKSLDKYEGITEKGAIAFHGNEQESNYIDKPFFDYSYLFVYGQCFTEDKPLVKTKLYLEKFVDKNQTNMLIAVDAEYIEMHVESMKT